jgi:AcrR family transcriptional regulator
MKKGEATRQRIVARTANLLNKQGYRSTPVSAIMEVAGLQKGGIYRHFDSRAELTLEAFWHAAGRMRDRLTDVLKNHKRATDQLLALLDVMSNAPRDQAFGGGCPIMNLAIESDDADPKLRAAAREAMGDLIGLFEQIIIEGTRHGEFSKQNARTLASSMVASLEGAMMLSNLYKDGQYLETITNDLRQRVQNGFR